MRLKNSVGLVAIALLMAVPVARADFNDPFSGPLDPAWVGDRFLPPVDTIGGTLNLHITTANFQGTGGGAFYNTQGITRPAGISGQWVVQGTLFVDAVMASTTGALERSDLWTRSDNPVEANSFYPIIGVTNASPTDPYNPLAADRTSRYRVWDSTIGWVDLGLGVVAGAHQFTISYNGTGIDYKIDGSTVVSNQAYDNAFPTLRQVAVQAFNYGGPDYVASWDNVSATAVPEPASLSILGLAAGGLLLRRRR